MADDVVRLVDIKYTTTGADQVAASNRKVSDSFDGVAVASDKSSKAALSVERSYDGLQKKYDVVYRATQQQTAEQTKLDTARKQGLVSDERYAFLQGQIAQGYQATVSGAGRAGAATAGFAKDAGLARHELVNLSRQAQDVAVSLGSGQSFGTVLLQQGSQIADVFASSGGTVRGFFGQVASGAAAMITPLNVAIAGTVALTAAAAALALQYDKVQVSSQRAISGAGARTGTTTSDLNAFVDKNTPSSFSGATLSQKESRALGEGLTQTGDIVIGKLQSMSAAVVGFSNQTGQSMDESVKAFAKMGSDPVRAMDQLAGAFGPFSQSTRTLVQDMVAAGDKTLAWNAILAELGPTAKGTAGNLTTAEVAARGLANVLQIAPKPSGLEKQLEDVRQKLNGAIEAAEQFTRHGVAVPPEASNTIAALNKQFETLYARQQAVMSLKTSATFDDLADKARVATEALIPQIRQIDELREKLAQLDRAKVGGATSKHGAAVDDSAAQAIRNQIAALQDAQGQAERYNQRVAVISTSWGNVGQSTALALQAMQNALPVAQAWTESGRMLAQHQATLNALIDQGKTSEEASAIAAQQYELAKAGAVANAQRLVQASEDNLDRIMAAGTGMEGMVASSQAYRDAIQGGATATQAAAIAANTLSASMLQAAKNAQQMEQSAIDAANGTTNGVLLASSFKGSPFDPSDNKQSGSFGLARSPSGGATYKGGSAGTQPFGSITNMLAFQQMMENAKRTSSQLADDLYPRGIDAAISALKSARPYDPRSLSLGTTLTDSPISQVGALYDLKNAQTSDKSQQVANLQEQLAWLKSLDPSLEVAREIVNLTQKIKALTDATVDNTAAMVSWNPLYTQGRSALRVGYMGAAKGFSGVVTGGIPGVDSVPLNIMAQQKELVQVHPVGWEKGLMAANSNGSKSGSTTVINQTNNFSSKGGNDARLSELQLAQGFGQIASSMSRR